MPTGKKIIYWDSCVFLAWLRDEKNWGTEILSGIEEVIHGVEDGNIILVTSIITVTEILPSYFTPERYQDFTDFLNLPSVQVIGMDFSVANLAMEIRNFYGMKKPTIELGVPDCAHLATGILYEADEIQTLDGAGKKRHTGNMISFSKNLMDGKYTTLITPPFALKLPFPESTQAILEMPPMVVESVKTPKKLPKGK